MKSILNNYDYSNKINFVSIEANYNLNEIPDKLIISKENELSNESKLLKHFLKNIFNPIHVLIEITSINRVLFKFVYTLTSVVKNTNKYFF